MTAEQLKNSILQMAVQGKLVPQDPNDEPASELIKRIREEKEKLIKEGKIKKEKNPSYIFRGEDNIPYEKVGKNEPVSIADEVPFEIPESWEWCRCSSLGTMIRGKGIKRTETVKEGFPCVRYGEIYTSYTISFDHTVSFIPKDVNVNCNHFNQGDVLFTLTGENKPDIAKAITYTGSIPVAAGGDLAYWTAHGMNPFYLVYFLNSPYSVELKRRTATGDIIVHISTGKVGNFLIPVPPLEEQNRIVDRIQKIEPYIKLYKDFSDSSAELNVSFPAKLKKSILQEAVMGKLVPQNENDEPASALLERIREEKQRLIAEGKLKKDKHESIIYCRDNSHYEKLDGVERCIDDEIPFEIPDSWEWIRLGNASTYADTKKKINAQEAPSETWGLDLEDVEKGGRLLEHHTIGERKAIGDKTCFCSGDILYSKLRPYLQKILIAPEDGICTPEIVPFKMLGGINHKYIVNYLKSPYVDNYINAASYGVKMPRAGTETMTSLLVPIPPIIEQARIVEAVDSLSNPLNKL